MDPGSGSGGLRHGCGCGRSEVGRDGDGTSSRCCSEGIGNTLARLDCCMARNFDGRGFGLCCCCLPRQNRYLVPDGSQDKQLSGLRTRFDGYGAPEGAGWRRNQTVQSAQKTLALASSPIRAPQIRHRPPNESSGCLISRLFPLRRHHRDHLGSPAPPQRWSAPQA